jgi:hypothetical protein
LPHPIESRARHTIQEKTLFTQGLLSNKTFFDAAILAFALQMTAVHIPFLNSIFRTIR